MVRDRNINE